MNTGETHDTNQNEGNRMRKCKDKTQGMRRRYKIKHKQTQHEPRLRLNVIHIIQRPISIFTLSYPSCQQKQHATYEKQPFTNHLFEIYEADQRYLDMSCRGPTVISANSELIAHERAHGWDAANQHRNAH